MMYRLAVLKKKCQSSVTMLALVSLILVAGTVFTIRLRAQTSASGSSTSASSAPTITDAAPIVTLSVTAANPSVGHRPGARSYYSTTVSDDKLLKSVVVTMSPMMNSSSPNTLYQCADKTSCEEKVYIIIPSNAGENFVTVTATDSANQVTTKTVTFQAVACTADAECGGGSIQWAGASYCSGDSPHIMQYGVAATCNAGVCDTGSKPFTKQQCGAGQVCTYGQNGVNMCIAQPSACTPGTQITSVCSCGTNTAYYYPVDWRVASPTFCCLNSNGSLYTTSPGPCPASSATPATASPFPFSSSSSSISSSIATTPMTSQPAGLSTPASGSFSAPVPSTSATPPTPAIGSALPNIILPNIFPNILPATPQQPTVTPLSKPTEREYEPALQKLRPSQIRTLLRRRKVILRQLQSIEKIAKSLKNTDVLAQIAEMRAEIEGFVRVDSSAYEMISDWTDELGALQEELKLSEKKSIPGKGVKDRE